MKNPKVAVVILNHNGWRDTAQCLKSFAKQTYKNYQIILIDNGSSDESVVELEKNINKKTLFIKESINHGFAGGVNIGIKYAIKNKFDMVALLNNDTWTDKKWLDNLVTILLKKPEAGIITGLLLDYDGKNIDGAGDVFSKWGLQALRLNEEPKNLAPNSEYVFGATGGASLYRTDMFKDIGLFDEKYFAYDEDVDISFRAQLAGYKIWYEKSAVAYHKHGATSNKKPGFVTHQLFRNLPMLHIKNIPFPLNITIGFRFFCLYWAFAIYKIPTGEFFSAVKGIFSGISLWPHAFAERRRIQKTKRVNYKYIKSMLYPKIPLRSARKIEEFLHIKIDRKNRY